MTIDQIKVVAAVRSGLREEVEVTTLEGETVIGTCTWAGLMKFRVDTPLAAVFVRYDEVETVR